MSRTTTYRFKQGDDYAEFLVREKGTAEWPELTLELECAFKQEFVDDLKDALPVGARVWDKDSRVWRLLPRYFDVAVSVAKRHYAHVWLTEGTEVKDLVTGMEQKGLFT